MFFYMHVFLYAFLNAHGSHIYDRTFFFFFENIDSDV